MSKGLALAVSFLVGTLCVARAHAATTRIHGTVTD